MTGKRFASCIMCFALTAALFSVSRGWASENEMNLTEERRRRARNSLHWRKNATVLCLPCVKA